jgi:hypothetical protein
MTTSKQYLDAIKMDNLVDGEGNFSYLSAK